jgi:hypothetical protein
MLYRVLVLVLFAACSAGAAAQSRPVPDVAKRGFLRHVQGMAVTLDGAPAMLSPGSSIRDQRNLIIVPTAVPPSGAWADYVQDPSGQVARVWLLTAEELRIPRPKTKK